MIHSFWHHLTLSFCDGVSISPQMHNPGFLSWLDVSSPGLQWHFSFFYCLSGNHVDQSKGWIYLLLAFVILLNFFSLISPFSSKQGFLWAGHERHHHAYPSACWLQQVMSFDTQGCLRNGFNRDRRWLKINQRPLYEACHSDYNPCELLPGIVVGLVEASIRIDQRWLQLEVRAGQNDPVAGGSQTIVLCLLACWGRTDCVLTPFYESETSRYVNLDGMILCTP